MLGAEDTGTSFCCVWYADTLLSDQVLACDMLQAFLRGEQAPLDAFALRQLADLGSSLSHEATLLEREITNYWLAFYFQSEDNKSRGRTWKALFLLWMRAVRALLVSFASNRHRNAASCSVPFSVCS